MKEAPNLKLVLVYGEDQATLELPLGGEGLYKIDYTKEYFGIPAHVDVAGILYEYVIHKLTGNIFLTDDTLLAKGISPPRHQQLFEACLSLAEAIRDRKAKL